MIMPPATLVPAIVVLNVLAVTLVSLVSAGSLPDSAQMAGLRQAVAEVPLVRVRGDFGTRSGHRSWLDSAGVRLEQELVGSRKAMVSAGTRAEPIPWNEITSLETERPGSKGEGAFVGGLIGFAVGGLWILTAYLSGDPFAPDHTDHTQRYTAILGVSVVSGTVLGALIGRHGQRRTVYPPPEHP